MQPTRSNYAPTSNPENLEILASEMTEEAQAKIEVFTAQILRNAEIFAERTGRRNFITTRATARAVVLALIAKTEGDILR